MRLLISASVRNPEKDRHNGIAITLMHYYIVIFLNYKLHFCIISVIKFFKLSRIGAKRINLM